MINDVHEQGWLTSFLAAGIARAALEVGFVIVEAFTRKGCYSHRRESIISYMFPYGFLRFLIDC